MALYDPRVALIFRKLFGSAGSEPILLPLINAVLNPAPALTELRIKNPYSFDDYVKNKLCMVKATARDLHSSGFEIDVNVGETEFFGKRAVYGVARTLVDQSASGSSIQRMNRIFSDPLNTAIGIHIFDFESFPGERCCRRVIMQDVETNETCDAASMLQFCFVELPKFKKPLDEVASPEDRWLAFLNHAHELSASPLLESLASDPAIKSACEILGEMRLGRDEQEIYAAALKERGKMGR